MKKYKKETNNKKTSNKKNSLIRAMISTVTPVILCVGISFFSMVISNLNEIYNKTKLFEKYIENFEKQIDEINIHLKETQNELVIYRDELKNQIANQQSKGDDDNINSGQYSMDLEKIKQRLNELEETINHYPENTQQATDYATLLEDINDNINNTKELISKNNNNDSKNDNAILICILSGFLSV